MSAADAPASLRTRRAPSADRVSRIRGRLLAWYRVHQRDLPWRRTRDPYAIWISESMLQQTRVETVIPYYRRFLERFPRVEDLARSELEEVLRIWAGLGYYSRARNLHEAAQQIVDAHGASLPEDPEALCSLPGVGRYTAGAVASIAFDRPEPIVDGNVARVLARLFAIEAEIGSTDATAQFWSLAARLADGPEPGQLNQALMELGATLCTPRAPRCVICPVKRSCHARRSGDPEGLPRKRAKARPRPVQAVAGWLARRGALLVVQRPANGLLGGLWELPGGDLAAGERPGAAIIRVLRERVGLAVSDATALGSVEHTFTHLALRLHVFRCADPKGRVRLHGPAAHRWVAPASFEQLPHAVATRKALALLRSSEAGA